MILNCQYRKPLLVSYCRNCFHFFNSKPIVADFKDEYSFLSSSSETLVKESETIADNLIQFYLKNFNKKPELIIEIASNDGCLMEKLKNFAKDSRIIGIEPSIIACEKSNLKGQKVINKYFNFENSQDILKEIKGYPNLIIARNVITHIQNIRDFIKGLRNIMDKESILFLQSHY